MKKYYEDYKVVKYVDENGINQQIKKTSGTAGVFIVKGSSEFTSPHKDLYNGKSSNQEDQVQSL